MIVIVEGGVRLKLNIVDTPGYGDQVNNEGCWEPIVRYVRSTLSCYKVLPPIWTRGICTQQIKDQYSTYLRKELTAQRDRFIPDTRIHCCLFFINPTGHSLKPVSRSSSRDQYSKTCELMKCRLVDRYHRPEEAGRGHERRANHRQIRLVDVARARSVQGASE